MGWAQALDWDPKNKAEHMSEFQNSSLGLLVLKRRKVMCQKSKHRATRDVLRLVYVLTCRPKQADPWGLHSLSRARSTCPLLRPPICPRPARRQ